MTQYYIDEIINGLVMRLLEKEGDNIINEIELLKIVEATEIDT